jgi:DNA mismatch repair ATPase MutS
MCKSQCRNTQNIKKCSRISPNDRNTTRVEKDSNERETEEIPDKEFIRMLIRMINEIKEDTHKELNELKNSTNQQLNEARQNSKKFNKDIEILEKDQIDILECKLNKLNKNFN